MATSRLVTIPYSHYCDKARWALERGRVEFVEEAHAPMFAWRGALGAGGKRTVPVFVTGDQVFSESTEVLRWVDAHGRAPEPLFPPGVSDVDALVELFDRRLGPATRRVAYFHVLRGDRRDVARLLTTGIPRWEATGVRMLGPLLPRLIRRGLAIDAPGVARSEVAIAEVFDAVAARLADGRRTLAGDVFTAADLTFAALAAPIILPTTYAARIAEANRLPPPLLAARDAARATRAGAFALAIYETYRDVR